MRHTARFPGVERITTFTKACGVRSAVYPEFLAIKDSVDAVTRRCAGRTIASAAVDADFRTVHHVISAGRARFAEFTSAVNGVLRTVEDSVVAKRLTGSTEGSPAIDTKLIAILHTVVAHTAFAAFTAAIPAHFAQPGFENAVDTVVALRTIRPTTVEQKLLVIQNSVVTVGWNLIVVIEAGRQHNAQKK